MYHDIVSHGAAESGFQNKTALKYKVSAKAFEDQVRQVRNYLDNKKLPYSTVVFTFDDGGESFLTNAAPILEKYGFRGVFFISTGYIGSKGFLDARQIKDLADRGHKIGSHSHSHPERMIALSVKEIQNEWSISQMMLNEVLGYKPVIASIPNGYSSKSVLNAMTNAGITSIYTSQPTSKQGHFKSSAVIGRYVVTSDTSVESLIKLIDSKYTRIKMDVRFKCLAIAKILLGDTYLKIREHLLRNN